MESSYKKLHLQGSALPPTASGLSLAKPEVTHFFEHSLNKLRNCIHTNDQ
jgi:hypothetical protein